MRFWLIFFAVALPTSLLAKQVQVDTSKSQILWSGSKKITKDTHEGEIHIKKASINLDKKLRLKGGTIIIDMNTITNLDQSGQFKTKLEAHLKSEDFFHVLAHPEASFKVTEVEILPSGHHKVIGNMTIRGKTQQESFLLKTQKIRKKGKLYLQASGDIKIKRSRYGISYGLSRGPVDKLKKMAKDKLVQDNFTVKLKLVTVSI